MITLFNISKIILAFSLGFSARLAKIQPNPYDYQIKNRINSVYLLIESKYERENGGIYRGLYLRSKPIYGSYGEIKISEADSINKQYLYKDVLDIAGFKIRTSYQWDYWKDARWLGGLQLNIDKPSYKLRYQYDTNLTDRYISRLKYELNLYSKNEIYYFTPYILHENHAERFFKGDSFWQMGIDIGIDFEVIRNLLEGDNG